MIFNIRISTYYNFISGRANEDKKVLSLFDISLWRYFINYNVLEVIMSDVVSRSSPEHGALLYYQTDN